MKKSLIVIAALVLVIATSCNRTRFESKLVGNWSLDRYLYAGNDESAKRRDTTMNQYSLQILEGQTYSESWQALAFRADTLIKPDTLSYDSVNMAYLIKFDTIPRVDTTVTPFTATGTWTLLNSEADLQLHNEAGNSTKIWRILNLSGSNLNLRNGSDEEYLIKK